MMRPPPKLPTPEDPEDTGQLLRGCAIMMLVAAIFWIVVGLVITVLWPW